MALLDTIKGLGNGYWGWMGNNVGKAFGTLGLAALLYTGVSGAYSLIKGSSAVAPHSSDAITVPHVAYSGSPVHNVIDVKDSNGGIVGSYKTQNRETFELVETLLGQAYGGLLKDVTIGPSSSDLVTVLDGIDKANSGAKKDNFLSFDEAKEYQTKHQK